MLDWDDLRFASPSRGTAALPPPHARSRVDNSTVFRHLNALEARLGAKVFERLPAGLPSDRGRRAAARRGRADGGRGDRHRPRALRPRHAPLRAVAGHVLGDARLSDSHRRDRALSRSASRHRGRAHASTIARSISRGARPTWRSAQCGRASRISSGASSPTFLGRSMARTGRSCGSGPRKAQARLPAKASSAGRRRRRGSSAARWLSEQHSARSRSSIVQARS